MSGLSLQEQLAEARRMHAERAARQRAAEASGQQPQQKTGKVVGGKYFANPPKQLGMKEYESIVNRYQRIQVQKKPAFLTKVLLDEDSAVMFQSYLMRMQHGVQRYGVMYGTVDQDGTVRCHSVYEPEQEGTATSFRPLPDKRLPKVDQLAKLLGWQRVGILVSSPPISPSDPVLTAAEVLLAAENQANHGGHCCLIQVRLRSAEDPTQMVTEAYQVSEQCVDIYKEGTLSAHPTRKEWIHSDRELEAVQEQGSGSKKTMVAKEATNDVDTTLFTVPVPISSFQGGVGNRFIRIYRPGEHPPTWENVKLFLKDDRRSSKTFAEQVADFHLLIFLAEHFDMKSDMPVIVDALLSKDSHAIENYEIMIKCNCGMM